MSDKPTAHSLDKAENNRGIEPARLQEFVGSADSAHQNLSRSGQINSSAATILKDLHIFDAKRDEAKNLVPTPLIPPQKQAAKVPIDVAVTVNAANAVGNVVQGLGKDMEKWAAQDKLQRDIESVPMANLDLVINKVNEGLAGNGKLTKTAGYIDYQRLHPFLPEEVKNKVKEDRVPLAFRTDHD